MFIIGLGTANPPYCYSQRECWEVLQGAEAFHRLKPGSRTVLRKVLLGQNGISHRRLALDSLEEAFDLTPDTLHARFLRHAPVVASEAARRALVAACTEVGEIDAVLVSTCTGYLCPGLTSYIIELLGLPREVLALDLVGQGCGAMLPNLRTAEALLASRRCNRVLSIAVEICSAAFYIDDDPGVLISACLFGDGAAAAVLSRNPIPQFRRLEWLGSRSTTRFEDRDLLRFEQRGGMLRNILGREVPGLAAAHAASVVAQVTGAAGLHPRDIGEWILHAGGREVLAALRVRLELEEDSLAPSTEVLQEFGNLSSPFVLFVLDRVLQQERPGGYWYLGSFGAGFSSHGALLKADG